MSFRRRRSTSPIMQPTGVSGPTPPTAPPKPCGWLKKQGGKFKTWKRRYFVLDGQTLFYYEKEDKNKLLGQIPLKGLEIEIPESQENFNDNHVEVDRFLFTIKPERIVSVQSDSSSRITSSHDCYLLSSTTEEDRQKWMHEIKKAMYRERGGAIFGFPLEDMVNVSWDDEAGVPIIVRDCAQFIRDHGMEERGIFRMCGRKKLVNQLANNYDRGERPNLTNYDYDVHTICGVLKKYFMDLPEPLIPYNRYDDLKATGFYVSEGEAIDYVINQLERLPTQNYSLLKYLCKFLREVSTFADINMMSVPNLASIFAPHILRCIDPDPNIEASATHLITNTMAAFITHSDLLFVKRFSPFTSRSKTTTSENNKNNSFSNNSTSHHQFSTSTVNAPIITNGDKQQQQQLVQQFVINQTKQKTDFMNENPMKSSTSINTSAILINRSYDANNHIYDNISGTGGGGGGGGGETSPLPADIDDQQAIHQMRETYNTMREKVRLMEKFRDERDYFQRKLYESELEKESLRAELASVKSKLLDSDAEVKLLRFKVELNQQTTTTSGNQMVEIRRPAASSTQL